jgi:hypothetical protein
MHVFVQSDRSHLTKVNCQSKKYYDSSHEFSEAYFIYILKVLIIDAINKVTTYSAES